METLVRRIVCLGALLVACHAGLHAQSAKRPNVLFIISDDLRPELGCYGNRIVKSPNIDKLAARGVVFNHAYCQQAVCGPSRASFLTGKRPDVTKVWDMATHFRDALPDVVTLPQYFKSQGYYCAALGKVFHGGVEDGRSWNEPTWFATGSTVDTDPQDWHRRIVKSTGTAVQEFNGIASSEDNDRHAPGSRVGPAFEISAKSDDELPDGRTAAEALLRLAALQKKGDPFFLAVGFLKPHLPFVAPKKYWDLYNPNDIPKPVIDHLPEGAPEFAGHDNDELHIYANIPQGNPIPEDLAVQLRHGYYACASYIDTQVGRLLQGLEDLKLADNTVVVFMGDNGWQLGEHGLWHKRTNFEMAARVPVIVSVPHAAKPGMVCEATVELLDLYPTLTELCGLPMPAGLDGRSLKQTLEDPTAATGHPSLTQVPRGGPQAQSHQLMGYSVRNDQWRMTVWMDRMSNTAFATELYDEVHDPAETVNVANKPDNKALMDALAASLPAKAAPLDGSGPRRRGFGNFGGGGGNFGGGGGGMDRGAIFDQKDTNHDGKLTREEFIQGLPNPDMASKRFDQFDTQHHGYLTRDEFINAVPPGAGPPPRGQGQSGPGGNPNQR
jgi:choline-sulfatase